MLEIPNNNLKEALWKLQNIFLKKTLTSLIAIFSISLLPQTASAQIGSASVHGIIAAQSQPQAGLEVQAKKYW